MEIDINTGISICTLLVWSFSAGVVWQKLKALEKAVMNGITTEQQRQAQAIENLKATCHERGKIYDKLNVEI